MSFELKIRKEIEKKHAFLAKGTSQHFVASHSQFVYGKLVETRGPYFRYYMSEYYKNGLIIAR